MKQNTKNLIAWGRHPSHGGAWMKLHEFNKAKNAARLKEGWTLEFHPKGEKPDAPVIVEAVQHTQGPWQEDDCRDAAGNVTIRRGISGDPHGDTDKQPIATVYTERDARLIAAAPDLLAALTECSLNLAKQIRTTNHNALGFNSLVDLQGQVLAALLKAKEAQ